MCSSVFTVEAWVKEKKAPRADTFLTTCTGGAKFSFDLKFDTFTTDAIQKVIYFDVGDGTWWLSVSRVPFDYQSQVWYHVAVVATPTGATYYVDGSQVGYATYTGIPLLFDSTHKVEIGPDNKPERGSCIAPPADSAIDEVAVYDYALTANQIWVHHLAGTGFPRGMIQQRSIS